MPLNSIMKHCETNFREDKALVETGLFYGIMVLFRKVSIRINIVFVFLKNTQVKKYKHLLVADADWSMIFAEQSLWCNK